MYCCKCYYFILSYGWVIFFVCVCVWVCVCLHTLHLYSLLCWWTFSWFRVLTIVNSATMNTGVHVSFWIIEPWVFFTSLRNPILMVSCPNFVFDIVMLLSLIMNLNGFFRCVSFYAGAENFEVVFFQLTCLYFISEILVRLQKLHISLWRSIWQETKSCIYFHRSKF